jgi:hypothetical protein
MFLKRDREGCQTDCSVVGVGVNTYYVPFLATIIDPLRHVALTAATKDRYYESAHAGAKHGEIVKGE